MPKYANRFRAYQSKPQTKTSTVEPIVQEGHRRCAKKERKEWRKWHQISQYRTLLESHNGLNGRSDKWKTNQYAKIAWGNNKKAHTANKKLWEKHTHLRKAFEPCRSRLIGAPHSILLLALCNNFINSLSKRIAEYPTKCFANRLHTPKDAHPSEFFLMLNRAEG